MWVLFTAVTQYEETGKCIKLLLKNFFIKTKNHLQADTNTHKTCKQCVVHQNLFFCYNFSRSSSFPTTKTITKHCLLFFHLKLQKKNAENVCQT